jgi:ubiquinone/menaquinone biosynthesis C-methylase UbiE
MTYTDDEWRVAHTIAKSYEWLKSRVAVTRGDVQDLSFLPSNFFDQALLIDFIEHVPNDRQAVREIHRILKTGGRVIVSVPTPLYPYYFTPEFDQAIGHLRHNAVFSIKRFLKAMNSKQ